MLYFVNNFNFFLSWIYIYIYKMKCITYFCFIFNPNLLIMSKSKIIDLIFKCSKHIFMICFTLIITVIHTYVVKYFFDIL